MSKRISLDYIQNWIYDKGSKTIILSEEYIDNKYPITMQCECGEIFTSFWNRMSNTGKCCCNKCGKRARTKRRKNIEEINSELEKYGYNLISEDFNNIHSIGIKDKKGYLYHSDFHRIKYGTTPLKFSISNPYMADNIKNYISLNKINVELISIEHVGDREKDCILNLMCSCGEKFKAHLDSFLWQNQYRCKKCSRAKSIIEMNVEDYLRELKIDYISQYTFEDCINKRKLKFDFYLPSFNTIIEVNGQQHYYEQCNFSMTLQEQKDRDLYKKNYCDNKNIKYIIIPFWDIYNSNKYKTIINKILE